MADRDRRLTVMAVVERDARGRTIIPMPFDPWRWAGDGQRDEDVASTAGAQAAAAAIEDESGIGGGLASRDVRRATS